MALPCTIGSPLKAWVMLSKLEYELQKLINLMEQQKEKPSRCCGGRKRLRNTFSRVRKALEAEKKKPNTAESAEDLARIESLLEELAKEAKLN